MLCNVQKRNKSHKNSLTMNRYANIIMPWKPPEGGAQNGNKRGSMGVMKKILALQWQRF